MEIILAFLGSSTIGPVAGYLASYLQSIWGPIASGSWFAACQSAAMKGHGAAASAGKIAGAAGAAVAADAAGVAWVVRAAAYATAS
ncbi:hypothetical protein IAU59_000348 [Kwoniella sp. CBS 9459]